MKKKKKIQISVTLNDEFETKTGRTAFIDGLLTEVFLCCKVNAKRSVHSPRYHLIINLIISLQSYIVTGAGGTATLT